MTESACHQCGSTLRSNVAAGLCPHCLLLRALSETPDPPPEPDAALSGRVVGLFEILEEIARGGMGVVYRAREQSLGRIVALKILRGGELSSADFLLRFHNEARAASSLIHPHIVPVYAFGEDAGVWYIAMQLMEGGSLAAWIHSRNDAGKNSRRCTTAQQREAAVIVMKLAQAVHHAHERGILHRDLKPENILLDKSNEPFLTDFGLARLTEEDTRVTRSHVSLGTPAYIAPEVARGGSSQATVSSDIYGLGAVFYELLTGRPPFSAATPLEVLRQVTDGEPRLPSSISQALERDLETICLKAMAKEPGHRYHSCAALAKDLNCWLVGQPIEARPVGRVERVLKWARRRPFIAGLLLLLSVSLLVNAIGSWIVNRNLRAASERQRLALVQSSVDSANRLLSDHDPAASLPFQIAAIRMEAANPQREQLQRRRLSLSLPDLPHLDRVWTHDDAVYTVAFNPNGQKILSASVDGTARIWDIAGKSPVIVMRHPKPLTQAMYSPDGTRVLTLCEDNLARCWNASDGRQISDGWPVRLSYYHMPPSPNASFSPDGRSVLTVAPSGLKIWNVETGELALPPLATNDDYHNAAFSSDGHRVVAARDNGLVEIWELQSEGAHLRASFRQASIVWYASFSPDNHRVVSVGDDNKAILWDADSGIALAQLTHHDLAARIAQATFAPQGGKLMTISSDHSMKVWDETTGAQLSLYTDQPKGIADARWDPTGQRIVTASFDGIARVWDASNAQMIGSLLPHERYVIDAMFSPSGKSIATACIDNRVRLWSPGPGAEIIPPESKGDGLVFQSLDGTRVAADGSDGVLIVTDLARNGAAPFKCHHADRLVQGEFSPAGDRIIALTDHGGIYSWETKNGMGIVRAKDSGMSMSFASMAFDSKGERFATTAKENKSGNHCLLTIWNARTLEPTSFPIEYDGWPNYIEFNPDGRSLLTSSAKGLVRVRDVQTGREVQRTIDLGKESGPAHFSPDGKMIATVVTGEGFSGGEARLWSVATHQQIGPSMSHEDGVPVSLFSPAGDRLATGGEDKTARIWSVPSGRQLTPPMPHEDNIRKLLFTSDGKILATGTSTGSVRLWDAETGNAMMPSRHIPEGIASMAFIAATSQFVVVSKSGTIRRWDFSPALQSITELERLSTEINGSKPSNH